LAGDYVFRKIAASFYKYIVMKPEIYLHISEPCHENWDNMSPAAKGKFCSGCSKDVIDFSLMSDNEVLIFFKTADGNTCGRFYRDQLHRPLQEITVEKKKRWQWLVAGFTSLLIMSKSQAQKKNADPEMVGKVAVSIEQLKKPDNVDILCTLSTSIGKVMRIDTTKPQKPVPKQETPASGKDSVIKQLPVLPAPDQGLVMVSGGVRLVSTPQKKYEPLTPAPWLKKILDTIKITTGNPLKIYPNPALKNSTIHITVKDAGVYSFELFDNNSRLVHIQENNSTFKHQIIDMQLPQDVSAGLYYIRMIDTRTKKSFVDKVIIQ
jgi:hypothetical protein